MKFPNHLLRKQIKREVGSPHQLNVLYDNANVTTERYMFAETETNFRMKYYTLAIGSSPSQVFLKQPDLNFFRKLP